MMANSVPLRKMSEPPSFTSDRRGRNESSWSGSDWSAGTASGVYVRDGSLVPFVADPSGTVGDQFPTSFETTSLGSVPDGWSNAIHGSRGGAAVDDTRVSNGSRALRNENLNTGSPSHSHVGTASYAPTGDHSFAFDYYVSERKNNHGSADVFTFHNLNQVYPDRGHNDVLSSWNINVVSSGYRITAFNGDGSGGGSNVDLQSAIFDRWVTLQLDVEYSKQRYFVYIDGTQYGPFGFREAGTGADFPVFANTVDNFTGWMDNFRPV